MKLTFAVVTTALLLISSVESVEHAPGLRGPHHRHRHHRHQLEKVPNLPAAAIGVEEHRSSNRTAEPMTEGLTGNDGKGVRSIETMVEGFAAQSAKEGVTPEMDTFVKQIDTMLNDDMKPKIIGSNDEAQLLLNNFGSAVETCGNQKQLTDVEINAAVADRTTKSAAYKECRGQEAILAAPKQACDDALEALKNAKQIACNNALLKTATPDEGVCAPGSGATYGSWVEAKAELFATKLKEYKDAADGCTSATEEVDYKIPVCAELAKDVNTKKAECDNAQQLLESAACAQAEKTSTACEAYTLCNQNALSAYNNAKPGIVQQEKDRKGEWRGLMRIQCLLGVFGDGGGKGVETSQIDTCKAKTHDTTHLDLAYPTFAGPAACIVGGTEPCLADYISEEYSSIPPEAPGKECTPCAWNTPTTTTTTTTTTTQDQSLMLDLDASRGANAVSSAFGTNFGTHTLVTVDGVPYWNLDGDYMQQQGSSGEWTVGQEYTHCVWIRWREANGGWRTLFRGSSDHAIIVRSGGTELGMYSNRGGGFRGSGFHITTGTLQFVCAVGRGNSATSTQGTTTLYVAEAGSDGPTEVGTADRVVSGTSVYRIGWPGQGPGKVAMLKYWNKALSPQELLTVFRQRTATGAPAGLAAPTTTTPTTTSGWQAILHYGTEAYTPTPSAVGDVLSTVGFGKLSDAAINAISDGSGYHHYKLTSGTDSSEIYVRTQKVFSDTSRAFGWSGAYQVCNTVDFGSCSWHAVSMARFDTEGEFGNNCARWFADYSANIHCYATGSSQKRCFADGAPCGHAMRTNVVMYKFGR